MTSLRLAQIFTLLTLVIAVSLAPLHLAMGGAAEEGLTARAVSGSIWSGRLQDARIGAVALGEVRVGLDPLALLTGARRLRFQAVGPGSVSGGLSLDRARPGLVEVDANLPLRSVMTAAPVDGRLGLKDLTVEFRDGTCRKAAGEVTLDRLDLAGVRLAADLQLAGRAACRGREMVVPLEGRAAGLDVGLLLAVDQQGHYRLDTQLRSTDGGVGSLLARVGFARTLEGYRHVDRGQFGLDRPA